MVDDEVITQQNLLNTLCCWRRKFDDDAENDITYASTEEKKTPNEMTCNVAL